MVTKRNKIAGHKNVRVHSTSSTVSETTTPIPPENTVIPSKPTKSIQQTTQPTKSTKRTEPTTEPVSLTTEEPTNAIVPLKPNTLTLPPHLTSWEILPSPYNKKNNIVIFYENTIPLAHMEITEETSAELLYELNNNLALFDEQKITGWVIKQPDNRKLPPLLHFTSNGSITESIELNETFLEGIMPELLKIHKPQQTIKPNKILNFIKKHKILTGIPLTIIGLLLAYSIVNYFINLYIVK